MLDYARLLFLKSRFDLFFDMAKEERVKVDGLTALKSSAEIYFSTKDIRSFESMHDFFRVGIHLKYPHDFVERLEGRFEERGLGVRWKVNRLSPRQKSDFERLRKRLELTVEVLRRESLATKADEYCLAALERIAALKDLRALRATEADVRSSLRERFSPRDVQKIYRKWHDVLGELEYADLEKRDLDRILKIVTRAKLRTIREAEFVHGWLESHYSDPAMKDLVSRAGQLLVGFKVRRPRSRSASSRK